MESKDNWRVRIPRNNAVRDRNVQLDELKFASFVFIFGSQ